MICVTVSLRYIMASNNFFLVPTGIHSHRNNYDDDCFCEFCRNLRVVSNSSMELLELYRLFNRTLPGEQNVHLHNYHRGVLEEISAGKTFKNLALADGQYLYLKCWAKNRAPWKDWDKKDLDKFCQKVNIAALVYEKWDVIVSNLTDSRMTEIDARNFSMNMFYEARDITWCLNYNEQMRLRKSDGEKLNLYSEDLYQSVKNHILNCGILAGMSRPNDPHIAAMMMKRLSKEVVGACKRLPHPPP